MNITPEIPRLDPVRLQARKHALMNEINQKPALHGWRLAVPATGLAAAVAIGAVWWTTPTPPQLADEPAIVAECETALHREQGPVKVPDASKSSFVEQREKVALVLVSSSGTKWFCLFDSHSQIATRKSDFIEGKPTRVAYGRVRPDARSAQVDTADGEHLTALFDQGGAVTWWQSDGPATLITFYDEAGHVLETVVPGNR